MNEFHSRRSVLALAGGGVAFIAGCTESSPTGRVPVTIFNLTAERRAVRVTIRRDGETVWTQYADVPPEEPEDVTVGEVDTEYALTDVSAGTRFDVRASLAEQQRTVSDNLLMDDLDGDPQKDVAVRILEDGDGARIDLST